jgi:hypothetical protein
MRIVSATTGIGGDNEYSRLPRFQEAGHFDGFGIRGLGAATGVVAGAGLPRPELTLLRRGFIRLLVLDGIPH